MVAEHPITQVRGAGRLLEPHTIRVQVRGSGGLPGRPRRGVSGAGWVPTKHTATTISNPLSTGFASAATGSNPRSEWRSARTMPERVLARHPAAGLPRGAIRRWRLSASGVRRHRGWCAGVPALLPPVPRHHARPRRGAHRTCATYALITRKPCSVPVDPWVPRPQVTPGAGCPGCARPRGDGLRTG